MFIQLDGNGGMVMISALLDDSDSRNLIYVPGDFVILQVMCAKSCIQISGRIMSVTDGMVMLGRSGKFPYDLVHVQISEILSVKKLEEVK